MTQIDAIKQAPLMVKKFYTMLLGGTLTMVVVSALLMSDSIIAGAFIGSDAVAGITLVTPLYALSAFFGSIFSLGVPILYSTEMGKFRKHEANRYFGIGLLMSILVGLALFALIFAFGDRYLRSYHPLEPVLEQARGYLFWMRFTILLLPLDMLMAEMVYDDGDESISTIANAVQGVGNITTSLVLSRFMGIRGIALASFLFTFVSIAILCTHLLKKSNSLRLNLCFSFRKLVSIVRFSVIDASSYLFLSVGSAGLNWFVSMYFGAEYLILVSVIAFCRESQLVFDGIGEAMRPILSIYLGEDCFPGVRSIYGVAKRVAVEEGILLLLLMQLIAPAVPMLLGVSDAVMRGYVVAGVRIISLGSVFVSLLYLSSSYYLLLDKIMLGLIVSALRDVLAAAPLCVVLGIAFGVYGFFAGFAVAPLVAGLISMLLLRIRYSSDVPLLLKQRERGKEALLYSLMVEPENIIDTRDQIGIALSGRGFDKKTVNRAMLLFEELFMLIHEKNQKERILAECAFLIEKDNIRIITRDTGMQLDLSDSDMAISSLRSYIISNVADSVCSRKQHLVTMSFNRNMFELQGSRK